MNAEQHQVQVAVDPQTTPTDLGCEYASVLFHFIPRGKIQVFYLFYFFLSLPVSGE